MMKRLLLSTIVFSLSGGTASAQVYRVAQMNTEQIRALDKLKTVVILLGGVLEEHGPHLPSFSDGYSNEWEAQKLADAIVERPSWTVLVFPTMPFGHAGANVIGDKYVFPGTYGIRPSTRRARISLSVRDELPRRHSTTKCWIRRAITFGTCMAEGW